MHTFSKQQLKERGITSSKKNSNETSFINILCYEHISIYELALKFNLTVEEAKKKLRDDFLELRNKDQKQISTYQEQREQYAFNSNSIINK